MLLEYSPEIKDRELAIVLEHSDLVQSGGYRILRSSISGICDIKGVVGRWVGGGGGGKVSI